MWRRKAKIPFGHGIRENIPSPVSRLASQNGSFLFHFPLKISTRLSPTIRFRPLYWTVSLGQCNSQQQNFTSSSRRMENGYRFYSDCDPTTQLIGFGEWTPLTAGNPLLFIALPSPPPLLPPTFHQSSQGFQCSTLFNFNSTLISSFSPFWNILLTYSGFVIQFKLFRVTCRRRLLQP